MEDDLLDGFQGAWWEMTDGCLTLKISTESSESV